MSERYDARATRFAMAVVQTMAQHGFTLGEAKLFATRIYGIVDGTAKRRHAEAEAEAFAPTPEDAGFYTRRMAADEADAIDALMESRRGLHLLSETLGVRGFAQPESESRSATPHSAAQRFASEAPQVPSAAQVSPSEDPAAERSLATPEPSSASLADPSRVPGAAETPETLRPSENQASQTEALSSSPSGDVVGLSDSTTSPEGAGDPGPDAAPRKRHGIDIHLTLSCAACAKPVEAIFNGHMQDPESEAFEGIDIGFKPCNCREEEAAS